MDNTDDVMKLLGEYDYAPSSDESTIDPVAVADDSIDKTKSAIQDNDRNKYTVLIVEDFKPNREEFRMIFEKNGFNVMTATNGTEGLEIYHDNVDSIDFVLTDAKMQGGDGFELKGKLTDPDLPVWMITAFHKDQSTSYIFDKGFKGYIEKGSDKDHTKTLSDYLPRIEEQIKEFRDVRKRQFHKYVENPQERIQIMRLAKKLSQEYIPRMPEDHGVAGEDEALRYARGVSYPENSDYPLMAMELALQFSLKGKDVIELCPGPGDLTKVIKEFGARNVIGIDGSDYMVDFARKKHGCPGVVYKLHNLFTMHADEPALIECADIVVCQNSMHHFVDDTLSDFFKAGIDSLRPGGIMYVSDYRREDLNPDYLIQRLLATNKLVREDLANTIQASLTSHEISDVLERFGDNISYKIFTPQDLHEALQQDAKYYDIVAKDPHPHNLDYNLSLRVVIWKK